MQFSQMRRLYVRKPCFIETQLFGPTFEGSITIKEISKVGFRIECSDELINILKIGHRVKINLPIPSSEEELILGNQVIWKSENCYGLQIIHIRGSEFALQYLIRQQNKSAE